MIRLILLTSVFFLCLSTCASSQTVSLDTLVHGNYAIAFSFSGLNLGGGIGGKYWFNDNYSMKVEASVGGTYSQTEYDSQDSTDYNTQHLYSNVNITCTFARYFSLRSNLRPYVCGIVGIGWTDDTYKYVYIWRSYNSRYINRNIVAGAGFGVEYWLTPYFSLSGEQSIRASYSNNGSQEGISVQNSTSSLILSVYLW